MFHGPVIRHPPHKRTQCLQQNKRRVDCEGIGGNHYVGTIPLQIANGLVTLLVGRFIERSIEVCTETIHSDGNTAVVFAQRKLDHPLKLRTISSNGRS